jgi:hypothetical protein
MDLSAAVTIQRPGAAPLDINSVRDPSAVGSSPVSGYMIESVDFSMIGVSAFTEDTPLVDGIDSYDPYLGGRQINMIISVYGNTYADFWDKITALNFAFQAMPRAADTGTYAALDADGKRKLSFTQPKTGGTYSLYMMVRPLAMPRFNVDNASVAGMTERGYSTRVQVSLIAEDPYKYYETSATFSRTGTGTISVVNSGTTIAWPVITWNRTSSTAISATLGSYTVSHSAGSNNVTDTFKTAESTSSSTLTAYSFFPIPPGTSTVSVVGQSGQTISITIREALV